MTTVDDVITSFSDDPNLLNVAVSRAKSQFYLVASGNEYHLPFTTLYVDSGLFSIE